MLRIIQVRSGNIQGNVHEYAERANGRFANGTDLNEADIRVMADTVTFLKLKLEIVLIFFANDPIFKSQSNTKFRLGNNPLRRMNVHPQILFYNSQISI